MLITTTTIGKPTRIDLTESGIAALTLLREESDAALGAALTPEEARALANALDNFATRHGQ